MSLSNPPSPATIDIEEIAKKILDLGLHSYGGYEENNRACIAQATTLITDLITEKENRARVEAIKVIGYRLDNRSDIPNEVPKIYWEVIRDYEATLKSKGRDE